MQPKQLTLKNFGPFIHETIDFEDFREAGLFLISGKTGAGKTTIFDGMTFALFGETSGQMRSGKEMRSMFATPDEETQVTFTFEHQGLLYEIARSPEQELKKKRGEGIRKQTAKVALTIYNLQKEEQKQFTKQTEVNQFIKDLLRVDAKQFFQIILLPQGEFRNFLIASSNEKEKLLRHLFGTELYQRLNEWLRQRQRQMSENLSRQQQQIELLTERFQWQEVVEKPVSITETLAAWQADLLILEEFEKQLNIKLVKAKERANREEQALYEGKERLNKWQEFQELIAKQTELTAKLPEIVDKQDYLAELQWIEKQAPLLVNLEQVREEAIASAEELATSQKQLAENQQVQVELSEQAFAIDEQRQSLTATQKNRQRMIDLLPYAEEVQQLQSEQTQKQTALKTATKALEALTKQLKKVAAEELSYQEKTAEKGALQTEEVSLIQAEHLVEKWQTASLQNQAAEAKIIELQQNTTELMHTITEETQKEQLLKDNFEECQSENAKMQIARLQLLLKPGEPCPVCGATEHPERVHQSYGDEEIAKGEANLKEAESALRQQAGVVQQTLAMQTQLTEQLADAKKQVLLTQQNLLTATNECAELLGMTDQKQSPQELLATRKREFEKAQRDLAIAEERLAEIAQQKSDMQIQQTCLQQENLVQQNHLQELSTKIDTLAAQLGQKTLAELQHNIAVATSKQESLETQIKLYDQQVQDVTLHAERLTADQNHWQKQTEIHQQKVAKYQETLARTINESPYTFTEATLKMAQASVGKIPELERSITEFQQERRFVTKRIQELQTVVPSEEPQLDLLEASTQVAKKAAEDLHQELLKQQLCYQQNQALLNELATIATENIAQLEEMTQLQQLFQTMSGDNPQKISIERYVLQSFLTEILITANQRLIKLTRGRYQFELAEEKGSYRSSTGLEINIFDDNAGMSRRAHTLSGGESFIAALALALSLADVIQNRAGGIAIEALFIDEGFGSLDEESLEMAMEALEMIESEGRLIGIISHVRELKDRIQQQLIVQAKGNGQSTIKSHLI